MKIIPIYILSVFFLLFSTITLTYAAGSDKSEARESAHTQHPPHDHQETNHIKKLDEGMQRKRKNEKKSH